MNGPDLPDTPDLPDASDPIDELLRTRVQAAAPEAPAPTATEAELVELTPRLPARPPAATGGCHRDVLRGGCRAGARGRASPSAATTRSGSTPPAMTSGGPRPRSSRRRRPPRSTTTSTTVPDTVVTAPTTTTVVGGAAAPGGTTVAPTTTPPPVTAVPTTTAPVGGTQVVPAAGGTVTVRWTATSATVVSVTPADGWAVERNRAEDQRLAWWSPSVATAEGPARARRRSTRGSSTAASRSTPEDSSPRPNLVADMRRVERSQPAPPGDLTRSGTDGACRTENERGTCDEPTQKR